MDESRYGKTPRRRILALGIPPAVAMMTLGGYWTLLAWGVVGNQPASRTLGAVGPIIAGFGVALAYVCIRPKR